MKAAPIVDSLLTVDEAMSVLRLSRSMLHQLVRRGDLAAVKFGRRTLFKRAAIEALIASHEQQAAPRKKKARR